MRHALPTRSYWRWGERRGLCFPPYSLDYPPLTFTVLRYWTRNIACLFSIFSSGHTPISGRFKHLIKGLRAVQNHHRRDNGTI